MLFETYDEKVEYCQDILNETLARYNYGLKMSGQIVTIADDVVEFDIYINDERQTFYLPFTYFEADEYRSDGYDCLSFILFTFLAGVREGRKLSSKEVI